MAEEFYTVPESPEYNAAAIRKIQDTDPVRASRNALCGQRAETQQNCEKKGHPGVPVPALLSFEKTNAKTNKREKGNGRRNHYQHKCRNRYRP